MWWAFPTRTLRLAPVRLPSGVNALANLLGHWRRGNVKWPCAAAFAVAGVVGTVVGSLLGKSLDGQKLLFLFAFVMAAVGLAMLRPRSSAGDPSVHINPAIAARLLSVGLLTGVISGFFGIGGGFLIVPGIMLGSGMPILNAIGSSLFSVSAFGFTTAASYALSGLVDWSIAMYLVAGGIVGGVLGTGFRPGWRGDAACWSGRLRWSSCWLRYTWRSGPVIALRGGFQ